MKNEIFHTGIRGSGYAKLLYEQKYARRGSAAKNPFLHLPRFSPRLVQNAIRLVGTDPDRFLVALNLLQGVEDGGLCIRTDDPVFADKKFKKPVFAQDDLIAEDSGCYYFRKYLEYENYVAGAASLLLQQAALPVWQATDAIAEPERFTLEQNMGKALSFITGGPGTGKTTILKTLLQAALDSGIEAEKIALCAPTGKAAKRMKESCTVLYETYPGLQEPFTIHRLLGYNPHSGRLRHTAENPLNYKLLIVDEASMVDLQMFYYLLQAIPKNTHFRMVVAGDSEQLLSVRAGSVFAEMIAVGKNVLLLEKTYRQKKDAEGILQFANALKKQNVALQPFIEGRAGVKLHLVEQEADIPGELCQWYERYKENGQILSPYNEGDFGVDGINRMIYEMNHPGPDMDFGSLEFCSGDPVIFSGNHYDLGVFNGETGLLEIKEGEFYFRQQDRLVKLDRNHMAFVKHAYCITVHKSQGSEYQDVCIVIPERKEDLPGKRMLYTAITRARESVSIICSQRILQQVLSQKNDSRESRLKDKILQNL